MDAIFALPLAISTLSSFGASVNLIAFYVIWATLVFSSNPVRIELVGTAAVRLLFYVFPSLLFFLFDILIPSLAVVLKAHGEKGLPGGKKRGRIRLKEIKVAGWALLNIVLSIAAQAGIEYFRIRVLGWRRALRVQVKLPMPWEIVTDLARVLLSREVLSYILHRFGCHSRRSIPFIASFHQTWYHALHAPFPLTAHYDHPIAYLLTRFVPTYFPAMFFRIHLLTFFLYLALISIEETFAYSGYVLRPASFFLGGVARRADRHVLCQGKGNFGPWGLLDRICGSNAVMEEEDEEKDKEREKDTVKGNEEEKSTEIIGQENNTTNHHHHYHHNNNEGENDEVIEIDIDEEIAKMIEAPKWRSRTSSRKSGTTPVKRRLKRGRRHDGYDHDDYNWRPRHD